MKGAEPLDFSLVTTALVAKAFADVPVRFDSLPSQVQQALQKQMEAGQIRRHSREVGPKKTIDEAELNVGGQHPVKNCCIFAADRTDSLRNILVFLDLKGR